MPIARRCRTRTYDGKEPAQHYVDSVILHGTPASVVEQIARLEEEIGLNYLMRAPLSRETFICSPTRCCRGFEHRRGDRRHVGIADLDQAPGAGGSPSSPPG